MSKTQVQESAMDSLMRTNLSVCLRAFCAIAFFVASFSSMCLADDETLLPTGYTNGLEYAFYRWSGSISRVPDVSGLTPVATGIVETIDYPATTEAWPGAPTNLTDRFVLYGLSLRASIRVL